MSLDPNAWTLKTQEAVDAAARSARSNANPEVTPDHLLAALIRQPDGLILPLVRKVGLDPVSVRNAADDAVAALPRAHGGDTRFGKEFLALMDAADVVRQDLTDDYISTEHLLIAIADIDARRSLEKYGRDLTERLDAGKLDPVIGRDDEIRRCHSGALPPHQEQPGAHRRAGRRQDRHRRGVGPPHRGGRCAGQSEGQAD
jgi:ATP-dependent Clp protease ATP-binding subunit ClpB